VKLGRVVPEQVWERDGRRIRILRLEGPHARFVDLASDRRGRMQLWAIRQWWTLVEDAEAAP
jgi:hypothetical protein